MAVTDRDIVKLYIALFGRAPEGNGFNYWKIQATTNNWDIIQLANNMYYAAAKMFPEYSDVRTVIENIYQNVLGKSPEDDPEGINYWVEQINNGATTIGRVAADIIYVAETQYPDHPATKTLENRTEVGLYVAQKIKTADINGDGKVTITDLEEFKKLIAIVTDDPTTIETAKQMVDKMVNPVEEYILKVGPEEVLGTAGKDLFIGVVSPLANENTLDSDDKIDGGDGEDVLQVDLKGNFSGFTTDGN